MNSKKNSKKVNGKKMFKWLALVFVVLGIFGFVSCSDGGGSDNNDALMWALANQKKKLTPTNAPDISKMEKEAAPSEDENGKIMIPKDYLEFERLSYREQDSTAPEWTSAKDVATLEGDFYVLELKSGVYYFRYEKTDTKGASDPSEPVSLPYMEGTDTILPHPNPQKAPATADEDKGITKEDEEQGSSGGDSSGSQGGDSSSKGDNSDSQSSSSSISTPSASVDVSQDVKIKEGAGWLNSAYIIFEQYDKNVTYTVTVDDKEIDPELIRLYDTYKYNKYDEATGKWTESTYTNVGRADALGLAAGSHTMKIKANGTNGSTQWSTSTMTVSDHDRHGFAFNDTANHVPGAYNMDGTLKTGAIVIYLTDANKKTVKATLPSGKGKTAEFTGIGPITQAIKTKNFTTPVCIRIVGQINGYTDIACKDMESAYALGVKGASNVTIEGVGHDATLKGAGVAAFGECENIEINNLGLVNWGGGHDGDGVSIKNCFYVWVHNCDVYYGDAGSDGDQAKGDGSMDLKDDSKNMTISYMHFWDSGKMSLCGMKSESGPNLISYHHNWFDHSDSRHPRIRKMSVHVYNNYFDGNAKYGVGVTSGGSCFVEGNYFRNAHDPMMSSCQGTDAAGDGTFSGEDGGVIKSFANKFAECGANGVKMQFITNKANYNGATGDDPAGKPLGKREQTTDAFGTVNADGTYSVVNVKVTEGVGFEGDGAVLASGKGALKGAYYQGKAEIASVQVPANATKIIVKAKCGSSTSSSSSISLSAGSSLKPTLNNSTYTDCEFPLSGLSKDTEIIIKGDGKVNTNVSGIIVIAPTQFTKTYWTGVSIEDIDAWEVDSRSDDPPADCKAKKGGTGYDSKSLSNDATLGVQGALPSTAVQAKTDVLKYSGRHETDLIWNFDNATDDASYALNKPLKDKLNAYQTGCKVIQAGKGTSGGGGTTGGSTGDSSSSGSSGGDSGSGSGSSSSTTPSTPPAPSIDVPKGGTTCDFTGSKPSNTTFTVKGSYKTKLSVNVNETIYTVGVKMETGTEISFETSAVQKLTLVFDVSGKKVKVDGTDYTTNTTGQVVIDNLAVGQHTITKNNTSVNLVYISLN